MLFIEKRGYLRNPKTASVSIDKNVSDIYRLAMTFLSLSCTWVAMEPRSEFSTACIEAMGSIAETCTPSSVS
jgi:hypothetical protein